MKKNLWAFCICMISILALSINLHWLAGLLSVFIVLSLVKLSPSRAFIIGFLSSFLSWAGFAYYQSLLNEHLLASQVGDLLGGLSSLVLTLITGFLGGLAGGLIGTCAALIFRQDL